MLTEAAPVRGTLEWQLDDAGNQRPTLTLPSPLIVLRLPAPWYVDPTTGNTGLVETDLPVRLVQAMLDSPPVPPSMAGRVQEELSRRWPSQSLPAPRPIAPPQILRERLQPQLLLLAGTLPFDPADIPMAGQYRPLPAPGPHQCALARLSWRYGPLHLPAGEGEQPDRLFQQDGLLFQVVRDRAGEQRAFNMMRLLGLERISDYHTISATHPQAADYVMISPNPGAWIEVVTVAVPRLRHAGWVIDTAGEFPWNVVEPYGPISFEVRERSGMDWFDLDLGVMVAGQRVSLVTALLDYIADSGLGAVTDVTATSEYNQRRFCCHSLMASS